MNLTRLREAERMTTSKRPLESREWVSSLGGFVASTFTRRSILTRWSSMACGLLGVTILPAGLFQNRSGSTPLLHAQEGSPPPTPNQEKPPCKHKPEFPNGVNGAPDCSAESPFCGLHGHSCEHYQACPGCLDANGFPIPVAGTRTITMTLVAGTGPNPIKHDIPLLVRGSFWTACCKCSPPVLNAAGKPVGELFNYVDSCGSGSTNSLVPKNC